MMLLAAIKEGLKIVGKDGSEFLKQSIEKKSRVNIKI